MEEPVSTAFGTILQTGLLGAAVVILSSVIVFLFRELKAERDRHKADLEKIEKANKEERDGLNRQLRDIEGSRLGDLRDLYGARMQDSDTIHKQMLDVVRHCTTVMETTAASLDGHKDATVEHRDAQKEAAEELRKLAALLVTMNDELKIRFRGR